VIDEVVSRLRVALAQAEGPFPAADLPSGLGSRPIPAGVPAAYAAFLRICNGASCGHVGEIQLFAATDVEAFQFRPEDEEWLPLPGGLDRWFRFGTLQENPLLLDRDTGRVWWFSDLTIVWYTDDPPLRSFAPLADTFDDFFFDVVAGPGYARVLGPIDDEMRSWQALLDRLGLADQN
jgi:hypothetical protein